MREALEKCGVDFDVLQPKLAEKPTSPEK